MIVPHAREETDIAPARVADCREAFHDWMRRWDYLKDGVPAEDDIDRLLRAIIVAALRE